MRGDVFIGELLADQCQGLWSEECAGHIYCEATTVSVRCDEPEWGVSQIYCSTQQCVLQGSLVSTAFSMGFWVVTVMEFSHIPTPRIGCAEILARGDLMLCHDTASNLVLEFKSATKKHTKKKVLTNVEI